MHFSQEWCCCHHPPPSPYPPPSIAVLGILKHALADLTALCLDVENKEQLAQTWKDEKSNSAKNLQEKRHRTMLS